MPAARARRGEVGSSPRGRGKRNCSRGRRQRERLIPARAGKTSAERCGQASKTAHPRAGGENATVQEVGCHMLGSSPRGRGKRVGAITRARLPRLIPARAGKTSGVCVCTFVHRAHPRAGGENHTLMTDLQTRADSSPRGRGKHKLGSSCHFRGLAHPRAGGENFISRTCDTMRGGSSPRGRGKHKLGSSCHFRGLAHPRAGGENFISRTCDTMRGGSSPRGRGKPLPVRRVVLVLRLIPARAGKTCAFRYQRSHGWAHPRAGGENLASLGKSVSKVGSSPRGRGKLPTVRRVGSPVRLIPARAGKTRPGRLGGPLGPAHPRAGGENAFWRSDQRVDNGSSPRGRGKPENAF